MVVENTLAIIHWVKFAYFISKQEGEGEGRGGPDQYNLFYFHYVGFETLTLLRTKIS